MSDKQNLPPTPEEALLNLVGFLDLLLARDDLTPSLRGQIIHHWRAVEAREVVERMKGSTVVIHRTFTLAEIEEAMESHSGFCLACGAMRDCVEPDARGYECEECGAAEVYGAEELVLMGRVEG